MIVRVICGKCKIEMACGGVEYDEETEELVYSYFCIKCGNEVLVTNILTVKKGEPKIVIDEG